MNSQYFLKFIDSAKQSINKIVAPSVETSSSAVPVPLEGHADVTVVVVGAGPVGLYFAKELKKRDPTLVIVMLEKHAEYSRHHYIKIESHFLDTNTHAHRFFALASSFTPLAFASAISTTKTMPIMDLERIWREEAISAGITIINQHVDDPLSLEVLYPNAKFFIGADGAKSVVRSKVFGDDKSHEQSLQFMVELRYKLDPTSSEPAKAISNSDLFKTRKILHFYFTEFIRAANRSDVIIRFLVDQETHDAMPAATFHSPVRCPENFHLLPNKLQSDIRTLLNVRTHLFGEVVDLSQQSATVTKTILGVYKASLVAKCPQLKKSTHSDVAHIANTKHWFLIGDAAMGLPFFRSLNAGLEASTKLVDMCTDVVYKSAQVLGSGLQTLARGIAPRDEESTLEYGLDLAATRHNTFYSVISFREISEAAFKSESIESFSFATHTAAKLDSLTAEVVNKTGISNKVLPAILDLWPADEIEVFRSKENILTAGTSNKRLCANDIKTTVAAPSAAVVGFTTEPAPSTCIVPFPDYEINFVVSHANEDPYSLPMTSGRLLLTQSDASNERSATHWELLIDPSFGRSAYNAYVLRVTELSESSLDDSYAVKVIPKAALGDKEDHLAVDSVEMNEPTISTSKPVCDELACLSFLALEPQHPNIVQLVDLGQNDHNVYMFIEFGGMIAIYDLIYEFIYAPKSFARPLGVRNEPFQAGNTLMREVQQASRQLVSALKHLHSLGIAHRDISDSNVMVSGDAPGEYRYKFIDFDLSIRVVIPEPADQPWTVAKVGSTEGSEAYRAPDIKFRVVDYFKGDVYALGVLIYQMTVGAKPVLSKPLGRRDPLYNYFDEGVEAFQSWMQMNAPGVPNLLIEMLFKMLQPSHLDRPTAAELGAYSWLTYEFPPL